MTELEFLKNCIQDFKEEIIFAEYAEDAEAVKHFKKKLEETEKKIKELQ